MLLRADQYTHTITHHTRFIRETYVNFDACSSCEHFQGRVTNGFSLHNMLSRVSFASLIYSAGYMSTDTIYTKL